MHAQNTQFQPKDPAYAARVRESFQRQKAMHTIGAGLRAVGPGWTEVELPHREELTQQKGFLHGGIIGMYVAEGVVLKSGRTLTVTSAEVYAQTGAGRVHVASMQQTVLTLADTPDSPE